jgi:predicted nuclease of predicted toxin-antitoxin system
MKLLADESVERFIVERLRADGHTVVYVAEQSPSLNDDEVLDLANEQQSLLLTADKDFGELVFRLERVHAGVVLLRWLGISGKNKAELISEALRSHEAELVHAFTVISAGAVRIRKNKP